jgi:hypothetical protein
MLSKIGSIVIICVVVVAIIKTGAFFTVRNWVTGVYGSGENAAAQEQQNMESGMAHSRNKQASRAMGTTTSH